MRLPRLVPAYWVVVCLLSSGLGTGAAVGLSVWLADRNADRQIRQVQEESARLRDEARLRACAVYGALVRELTENPPRTDAGRSTLGVYREQLRLNRCV